MKEKNQVCLSAVMMFAVAGFAGYISQISNYWFVFIFSVLITLLTLSSVLFDGKELRTATRFEWISICAFFGLETILTFCISVLKLPYSKWLVTFSLFVQAAGLLLLMFSIIRYVLAYTKIHVSIKEMINNRKSMKMTVDSSNSQQEVASQVEETIASEEVKEELVESQQEVYEFVDEVSKEPEVIGIELKEEPEIATPYMEEEM